MKTKTPTCCNKTTFATEEEARRYWVRMERLGLSRVLPTDVEQCARGWHLTFPPATRPVKSRKALARTSLKKPGKPKSVPVAVKHSILRRSAGICEVGLACGGTGEAQDAAHREGKGTGGTRKPWSNTPSCLLAACRRCHRLIDGVEVRGAEFLGLKIRAGVARPWEIPVKHARYGWVLLDNDGRHRPAPAGSYADGKRPAPVIACTVWELINQDGAVAEAIQRFGHADCARSAAPREGLYVCGCGSSPFLIEAEAS